MSTLPWVYIAGPYSAHPTRCSAFAMDVWEGLRRANVHAVCPHWSMQQDTRHTLTHEQWITFDLALIERLKPDALVRLPGSSDGADQEVAFAESRGIPVMIVPPRCWSAEQCVSYIAEQLRECPHVKGEVDG